MKRLIEVLNGNVDNYTPIWLMRQAGRYLPEYREIRSSTSSFLEMCYTPRIAAEITLQPIKRFDLDAAIIFSDILLIPHALGMDLKFEETVGPTLKNVKNLNDHKFIENLAPVYEALNMVRASLPLDKSLIGFAGSPWTLASYILEGGSSKDFLISRKFSLNNPEEFTILIEKLIKYIAQHLIMQIKAGADIIQLFDSWAGVLNEGQFRKWVIEPTAEIVKIVKAEFPHIPIIGFPRGAGFLYLEYAKKTGIDVISVDQNVPKEFIINELQEIKTIQGNLDPVYLFSNDQEFLKQEILKIKNGFKKPFIFNLGHGVLPGTPIENVKLLVDTVRES